MIDLHMHSTASDGVHPPAELMRRAAAGGTTFLALTDHDTFDGFADAEREAHALGLEIRPAAEVTTTLNGRTCHILAFFDDLSMTEKTAAWLAGTRRSRDERLDQMCSRLNALGIPLTPGKVREEAGRAAIHRPHVARALHKMGVVKSSEEAFRRFLRDGGPAYVKFESIDAREAIWKLREEGAYTSLAHAAVDRFWEPDIRLLAGQGLDAVEVYHSEHSPSDRRHLKDICDRLRLEATGGSDYHGEAKCRFYSEASPEKGVPPEVRETFERGLKRARELAPRIRKMHGA